MIVPSIDIQDGKTVQLIGGKELAVDAGDPRPIAKKFGRVGEIAVIDLDAAMTKGSNKDLIEELLNLSECRVGGGIRDLETAEEWLNAGAAKIILGTAATPELLERLPKERLIAAIDAYHGDYGSEVVDNGWQQRTGESVLERISRLQEFVSGFLITFVEREGRMAGIDIETIKSYQRAAGETKLTVAGGVATPQEIAELDRIGIDAQIGMAIYTERMSLAEGFCGPLKSDRPDGLWPTIVQNSSGTSLGLVYSNQQSVNKSLETGDAYYWSRKRGLWQKGKASGDTQKVKSISMDCDRDCLVFTVEQHGRGFCHLPQDTCFGQLKGLAKLEKTLNDRITNAPAGSYSKRLFESPELLKAKIIEEAQELVVADSSAEIVHEAADLLFFTVAKLVSNGVSLDQLERELDRRASVVTRRGGDAKKELVSK